VCHGKLQDLSLTTLQVVQMTNYFAKLLDNAACCYKKELAGLGQPNGRSRSIDQRQSQALLQTANTTAKRWLRYKSSLSSLRKTVRSGQGNKIFQPLKFEVHGSSQDKGIRLPASMRHIL
jgi:hypothetical protein